MKRMSKFILVLIIILAGLYIFRIQVSRMLLTYVFHPDSAIVLAEADKRDPANLATELIPLEGPPMNLSDQRGKIILINFWHPS